MRLPEPTIAFSIPSIHDDTTLDCRLYVPRSSILLQDETRRAAIFAHPYAPFGGCSDDPVVATAGGEILKQGYILCTFNFRGAHGSKGHTSWSGKPEAGDYSSVIGFVVYFLASDCDTRIRLIIGGYSYGSTVASHTPPPSELLQQFRDAADGSAYAEIKYRARQLAAQVHYELSSKDADPSSPGLTPSPQRHRSTLQVGGEEMPADQRHKPTEHPRRSHEIRRSIDLVRRLSHLRPKHGDPARPHDAAAAAQQLPTPVVEPAYLLLSPLLPPSSLIAYSLGHGRQQKEALHKRLSGHASLAVYGAADAFTSARRLRPWAAAIAARPGSRFTYVEVEGAGHFWHEDGVERKLRLAVREWVRGLG